MRRPDVEKYEELAHGAANALDDDRLDCDEADYKIALFDQEAEPDMVLGLCAYIKHLERKMEYHFDQSLAISGETQKEIGALKAILRDWLAECPSMCGQCDDVRERAEEAVK